ncbi:hypothetical protein TKK_0016080 [Trichogramma kaykai]
MAGENQVIKSKKKQLSRKQRIRKKFEAMAKDIVKGMRILKPHEKNKFICHQRRDKAKKQKLLGLSAREIFRREAQRSRALRRNATVDLPSVPKQCSHGIVIKNQNNTCQLCKDSLQKYKIPKLKKLPVVNNVEKSNVKQ